MVHGGELKFWDSYAKPEHFFDWKYAQTVWFDLNTYERYTAERAKYEADFKPWLVLHKKDKRKALADLKTYPEAKRRNIERGYDMQLAFDQWADQVYVPWYKGYAHDATWSPRLKKKATTFDDYLAARAKRGSCIPEHFLNECGPIPDWRDDGDKAEEQAMMRKVADELAAKAAKK